ncbi:MAG: hypothetical protein IBJ03_18210 [Gemmatimonadaceae bacterium]|nr:hypothetical protein [Gemmatimonadaceae bacterium]
MGLWEEWRASRARRQRAERYLSVLLREPDAADVQWLKGLAGDDARANRELAFSRRAIGLIVAERDALDDRTAAEVAHLLAPVVAGETRRNADHGREWADRWRAYTAALAVRGSTESPAARIARVMLHGAGVTEPSAEILGRGTQFVVETRTALNESLRAAFGVASLPEDVRPSTLGS